MSSTQLPVLGVVRKCQPVHGYDIRRTLLTWLADEWATSIGLELPIEENG